MMNDKELLAFYRRRIREELEGIGCKYRGTFVTHPELGGIYDQFTIIGYIGYKAFPDRYLSGLGGLEHLL
jgi:hypothetical protein